MHDWA
jgi:hypothetical protein